MEDATRGVSRRTPEQVCALLAAERSAERAAVAFDADGTLWSGDVGDDVFRAAIEAAAIRDAAGPGLARAAREHGLEASGSPSDIARAIFDAHLARRFPERLTYEVMTWCYAGWTPAELVAFARNALGAARIDTRLHRQLEPIVSFCRSAGLRTVVISASPWLVVCEAAKLWRFEPDEIAGALPAIVDGVFVDRMERPLPYGETKAELGRALIGDAQWLAAFGDSAYDIGMFTAARLGVAVEPKPELERTLASLSNVVLLA